MPLLEQMDIERNPSCGSPIHWLFLSQSHLLLHLLGSLPFPFSFVLQTLPLSSSTGFVPSQIWPPGRCVALEQALLIEHLFRHDAGSVACGRAAGGSSRGDVMSYYISWEVSFTCMDAHFTVTHSHRHSNTCHAQSWRFPTLCKKSIWNHLTSALSKLLL